MIKYQRHIDAVDGTGESHPYASDEIDITDEQKSNDRMTRQRWAVYLVVGRILFIAGVCILVLIIKDHQTLTSQEEVSDSLKTVAENFTVKQPDSTESLSEAQNDLNDLNKTLLDSMRETKQPQYHETYDTSTLSTALSAPQKSNCASKRFNTTFAKFDKSSYEMGCNKIGKLCDSQVIDVNGSFCHSPKRFTLNLVGSDGIAFHFDVRFDHQYGHRIIAINSMFPNGTWMPGITPHHQIFPFQQNERYHIQLFVEGAMFKMEANGQQIPPYTLPSGFKMDNIRAICGHIDPQCYKYNIIRLYMNHTAV